MTTNEDIDLIDLYLKGSLPPGEVSGFENRIKTDPAFAEQVQFLKDLGIGIKLSQREELKKKAESHF